MLEFATLLLGLLTGPQPVELVVSEPVRSVSIALDGEQLGRLDGPPWRFVCDLGPDLRAHELVVSGYDTSGALVTRARQLINVAGPSIDAQLVYHPATAEDPGSLGLLVSRVVERTPLAFDVRLDGTPLPVEDPRRIPLPKLDPVGVHVVDARVTAPDGRETRLVQVLSGNSMRADSGVELTPLPFRVAKRRAKLAREDLEGKVRVDERAAEVVAVERGEARVLLVVDPNTVSQFTNVWLGGARFGLPKLEPGDELQLLWPLGRLHRGEKGSSALVFPRGETFDEKSGAFYSFMRRASVPPRHDEEVPALVDAIAAAGKAAMRGGHRRAVVVLLAGVPDDESAYELENVRGYLTSMGVPLHLWSLAPGRLPSPWDEALDVRRSAGLAHAFRALTNDLARQRIAWIRGEHLPDRLRLEPGAPATRVATD